MNDIADDGAGGMLLVEAVESLKASWLTGESSLGSIGSQLTGRSRTQTLLQLVLIDSEFAISSKKACEAEAYINLFPELETERTVIQTHIAKLKAELLTKSRNSSAGLFSKASVAFTVDAVPAQTPNEQAPVKGAMDSTHENELPVLISSYRIIRELGRGSFGQVILAEDPRLDRKVAIKLQDTSNKDPGLSNAFLHEARAIARLEHPHIVRLLHVDETVEGLGYLVYEYVPGSTLFDRIKLGNYKLDESVRWITEIASALDFAHRRGVVHRDISPNNIMIDETGTARLLDFGLSRLDDQFHVADEDRILGTPNFMSPEQASGKPHWATSYSDLFSLGSVLYYALTKKLPFTGSSLFDICERVQSSTPPPPRSLRQDISPELEAVVRRVMAKEPQERYSTGEDFASALRTAVAASSKVKRQPSPSVPSTRQLRVLAFGMVFFGIAVLGWNWKPRDESLSPWQSLFPTQLETLENEILYAPQLEKIGITIERDGQAKELLSREGIGQLPLLRKDTITLTWKVFNKLNVPVQPNVILFGDDPTNPVVISPSSTSYEILYLPNSMQREFANRLFSERVFALLCFSERKLTNSDLKNLPSPWFNQASPNPDDFVFALSNADVVQEQLSSLGQAKLRASSTAKASVFELNRDFKECLADESLGIHTYFGCVIDLVDQP